MEISVSLVYIVYMIAIHLGMSLGWHTGGAISERNWLGIFQQYFFGIAAILVATIFLIGFTNWFTLGLVILLGFGIGLAYDDKEDHPPQGMIVHMADKLSGTKTEIQDSIKGFNDR